MYAVTSVPLDSRTRAIFRSAEFGFFGVIVLTCKHTPRFCGHPCMAGCFGFDFCGRRGLRINWLIVGMNRSCRPANHVGRSYRPMTPVQGEVIILIGAWTPGQWWVKDFARFGCISIASVDSALTAPTRSVSEGQCIGAKLPR